MKRAIIIVLDGVGVGYTPDSYEYGDEGANTLSNVSKKAGGIRLPNLEQLGIGNLTDVLGVAAREHSLGAYGKLAELSKGKDTITGHWELMGLVSEQAFNTYPDGFPNKLIEEFETRIGRQTIGNEVASGTEIIERLGVRHMQTGSPIVYTSADSVFQLASHESVISRDRLYEFCAIARRLLMGENLVARVIARPFAGQPGGFFRTDGRKDFAVEPPADTVLDIAAAAGKKVVAIGKIEDIFSGRGIHRSMHTKNNREGIERVIEEITTNREDSHIVFANLVDFDSLWGHRNDAIGFAGALEEFDAALPAIVQALSADDVLFITADHGCDPTMPGTDHSREYVPVLVVGARIKPGTNLGTRRSFADLGASVSDYLGIALPPSGQSFYPMIKRETP